MTYFITELVCGAGGKCTFFVKPVAYSVLADVRLPLYIYIYLTKPPTEGEGDKFKLLIKVIKT